MEFLTSKNVKIDIDALKMGVDPNEDQLLALKHLCDFIESPNSKSTVLSGSAGTGKTFCVNTLIQIIKRYYKYDIVLAAPTHKAKNVLARFTNKELVTSTLHSLLGLKPNVSIADFDAKNIDFLYNFSLDFIKTRTLYIIDECSMINDKLFEHIIETLGDSPSNKILFIGDAKQLNPVKQIEKSSVFTGTDFAGFTLTKVMRQKENSILLGTLEILRDRSLPKIEPQLSEDEGIRSFSTAKTFMEDIHNKFETHDFRKEPFKYKVLVYTNKRVKEFNGAIRKMLGYDTPFVIGEVLMGYDNFSYGGNKITRKSLAYDSLTKSTFDDNSEQEAKVEIFNSNDYILMNFRPCQRDIPFYSKVNAYAIKVLDTIDNSEHAFYMLDPELPKKVYDEIAMVMESIRLSAIDRYASSYAKKKSWEKWYQIKDSFWSMKDFEYDGRIIKKATFDYGYAISIHKSQGSTYEEVFIDNNDVQKCISPDELRSLQYVALSRAKKYVNILQ